jgi:hypothetical protein
VGTKYFEVHTPRNVDDRLPVPVSRLGSGSIVVSVAVLPHHVLVGDGGGHDDGHSRDSSTICAELVVRHSPTAPTETPTWLRPCALAR